MIIKNITGAIFIFIIGVMSGLFIANDQIQQKFFDKIKRISDQKSSPFESGLSQNQERSTTKAKGVKIAIGGDVMFDRAIRALGERNGYDSLFDDQIVSLFEGADLAIINLEGPITTNPSKTLVNGKTTDSYSFTFAPESVSVLLKAGIDMVSLANNHTDNAGLVGFLSTQLHLSEVGIRWFGNPWNSTSTNLIEKKVVNNIGVSPFSSIDRLADSPIAVILEKNDIRIALVGYHRFQNGIDRVITETRRVSGDDTYTIVMPHWGDEYVSTPREDLRTYARSFIEAGADAIIGAHPHVIMSHEWIGSKPVFYSLGNLLFDQYFSPEVKKGIIVEIDISKDRNGKVSLDSIKTHEVELRSGKGVSYVGEI